MQTILRVLLLCAAALAGAVQAADLEEPAPIPVPQLAPELVEKAIRLAGAERRWTVAGQEPGVLVADLAVRTHLARVRIAFDSTQVTIRYLESLNLDYEEDAGKRTIHRSYNAWVEQLAESIAKALQRSDLAAVEAPRDVSTAPAPDPLAPPPRELFGAFAHIELAPLVMAPDYQDGGVNQRAAEAIDSKLRARLEPRLANWNAVAAQDGRTLRIEPRIEDIRLIGPGARVMIGAMAGSSSITMKVRYVEPATGAVIAEPVFKGGRDAQGGDRGAADNGMLEHVAQAAAQYTIDHYAAAEAVETAAGPARILEPTDTVAVIARYGDGVGTAALRQECPWLLDLPGYIARTSRPKVVKADPAAAAAGLVLDIAVTSVHASGGGRWGGPKHARLRGELREGSVVLGSFEVQRHTGGGFTACAAVGDLAESMGKDIATWLQRPTLNARLGDLRKK